MIGQRPLKPTELKRLLQEAELTNQPLAKLNEIDEPTSLPNKSHF